MIRVVWEKHDEALITFDVIRDTLEKSRDRIRDLANMVLTASGLLLSSCFVFIVLLIEKFPAHSFGGWLKASFVLSSVLFLLSAIFSILSALLRPQYTIVTELKFVDDLLKLYRRELSLFTFAFVSLLAGLIGVFASVVLLAACF